MKPTAGRIVLYVLPDGQVRPAVVIAECNARFGVTSYQREECQLHVFLDGTNDVGLFTPLACWRTSVPHDDARAPGTWHWPPRA